MLVQFVGGLRQATAARADERVRLTGEVISGALAMKMLSWEDPFTDAICSIRKQARAGARGEGRCACPRLGGKGRGAAAALAAAGLCARACPCSPPVTAPPPACARAQEVRHSGRMAQIRALNLALQFAMTTVVAFVTFSVYRAMAGELNVPSVFYALRCGRRQAAQLLYLDCSSRSLSLACVPPIPPQAS
jgi:hypothetical protein